MSIRPSKTRRPAAESDPPFVVLHHVFPEGHARKDHWDLMLKRNGKLTTWALESFPESGKTIPAKRLADHRLTYLYTEGPISGDRGSVTQKISGHYYFLPNDENYEEAILSWGNETWRMKVSSDGNLVSISFASIETS